MSKWWCKTFKNLVHRHRGFDSAWGLGMAREVAGHFQSGIEARRLAHASAGSDHRRHRHHRCERKRRSVLEFLRRFPSSIFSRQLLAVPRLRYVDPLVSASILAGCGVIHRNYFCAMRAGAWAYAQTTLTASIIFTRKRPGNQKATNVLMPAIR